MCLCFVRKGTRDVLGMSFAEQRYIMRQKQQQNEAMPWEDPHQSVVPFVYLTSPLFSTNISSIGIETRDELLSELRQKILSINKKRPQFVIINSFQPPDNDTLKLLGKISETVSVILNDGSASNGKFNNQAIAYFLVDRTDLMITKDFQFFPSTDHYVKEYCCILMLTPKVHHSLIKNH